MLMLAIAFTPKKVEAQPLDTYYIDMKFSSEWGFIGYEINITGYTDYQGYNLKIYNPSEELMYDQNHIANSTQSFSINENYLIGDYKVIAKVPQSTQTKYFTVLNRPYRKASFPYMKEKAGLTYTFYKNSSINVNDEMFIQLPDLVNFFDSVKCYDSENVLTARIKDQYINALVDLSFFFLHDKVKLYINGTLGSPIDFRFKISTRKNYSLIGDTLKLENNGMIGNYLKTFFEWGDLQNYIKEYSNGTYYFQIKVKNVPKDFVLDPSFGRESIGGNTLLMFDTIRGDRFLCPDSGTADSISMYISSEWDSGEDITCAIYDPSDDSLIGTTETRNSGGSGWQTFTFSAPKPSLSNQLYMLVMWGDAPSQAEAIVIPYNTASWYRYYKHEAGWPASFPDPFDGSTGNSTFSYYSIYCNYSVGVGNSYSRYPNLTLSYSSSFDRTWNLTRAGTHTLVWSSNMGREWNCSKSPSLTLSFSSDLDRTWTLSRTVTASFTFVFETLGLHRISESFQRIATLALTFVFDTLGTRTEVIYATVGFVLSAFILLALILGPLITLLYGLKR